MLSRKIVSNTSMLMLLNLAKLVFPFITLPYLTRVMTTDCYGVVAYVKAVMVYMQVIVDFGFTLSATRLIVENKNDKTKMEEIIGINIVAKIIVAIIAFAVLRLLSIFIPILRTNLLFTSLSFVVVFLTIFLYDFFFRGIEKMHIITMRFIVMKSLSTLFTFVLVKNDRDLLLIPILDIVSSMIAVILVYLEIRKLGLHIKFKGIKESWKEIKHSFVYFLSNVSSTSFNAFTTVAVGMLLKPTEIAYWSVCMQIINAVQAVYTPISEAIYPEMIRTRSISIIKKVLKVSFPILICGCIMFFFFGEGGLLIVGGKKYITALPTLRALIPVLFFGFFSVLLGWPMLGAIGRVKETTITTVTASVFQIAAVFVLLLLRSKSLVVFAIIRSVTEIIMCLFRYYYCRKYRNEFELYIRD